MKTKTPMVWKIDYLKEDKILRVKVSGVMDKESHKKMVEEVYPFALKNGYYKVFIDFREMVPDLSVLEIDDLPNVLKNAGVNSKFRIASLFDENAEHFKDSKYKFYKTVLQLRSIPLRQFFKEDEAIAWLKQPNPKLESQLT